MSVEEYKSMFGLDRVSPLGWGSGKSNSFYGRRHSPDSVVYSTEYRNNARSRRKGRHIEEYLVNISSEEWRYKMSKARSGKRNPMYCGGISKRSYPYTFLNKRGKSLKTIVREREEFKCFLCGKEDFHLDVHHIDYCKNNVSFYNLVALCKSCHMKTNNVDSRDLWTPYLQYRIEKQYGNLHPSLSKGTSNVDRKVQRLGAEEVSTNNAPKSVQHLT
jgi:5-methylcytosine-specific restriction endonuclease McrA